MASFSDVACSTLEAQDMAAIGSSGSDDFSKLT
jgi:hypothetical protein